MHRVCNDFFRVGAEFFGESTINQFRSFGNVLEVAKNRMWGIVDLMVDMHYEIESRRFKNTFDEVIHYGWETEPTQSAMDFSKIQETLNAEVCEVYTETDEKPLATTAIPEPNMPFAPPTNDDAPF